eukprot:gnl/Spiro4/6774_TR3500_c0_g1_i1.p2 gnl/Spiro4/6774_TR3500_c0_g1~~gnl/Spiro4/6774_TR3500_c0_g1_i1.p2  ORF type:complete len:156 (+),score=30.42 gnl/Spiro4/6774_TR3500_c0_g1_i1:40-507(+)
MRLILQVRAELENVASLTPHPDTRWYMRTKCGNCSEESPTAVYMCFGDELPLHGSRGTATHVAKCKFCERESSIDIVHAPTPVTVGAQFCPVLEMECRGMEPFTWEPRSGWDVLVEESPTVFTDIDLSDGDWSGYCDQTQKVVGVYQVESRFVRA